MSIPNFASKFGFLQSFLLCAILATASCSKTGTEIIFPDYQWVKLGNGIYVHSRVDPLAGPVDGNSTVIINDTEVFVVDSHINPAATRAVINKIQSLTENPVTYLINTHWHDDHVNGNQAYKDAYPEVEIVAHSATLKALQENWPEAIETKIQSYANAPAPDDIYAAAESLEGDDPLTAVSYRVFADYSRALSSELSSLKLAYPTTIVDDYVEYGGHDRKIVVQWVGPGNTDGDLIVWLPENKLLVTGDLVVSPVPYAFDAPLTEWVNTLDELLDLGAKTIVPGHGEVQNSYTYLSRLKTLLTDTISEVKQAQEEGATLDTLSEFVDLTSHEEVFVSDEPISRYSWQTYYFEPALKSAWMSLGFPAPSED